MPEAYEHILVSKLRHLGDVVIITPLLRSLRSCYPRAVISVLVNRGTEGVLDGFPFVDRVLVLKRGKNALADVMSQWHLIRDIRDLKADLFIALTGSDREALYGFLSGAKRRIGFRSRKKRNFDRHFLFTEAVNPAPGLHIVDHQLEMLKHLACGPAEREPVLYWSAEDEAACNARLSAAGISAADAYAVMHPTAPKGYKMWRMEGYAALCDHLHDTWHVPTVLISGPDERERTFLDGIRRRAQRTVHDLGGQVNLKELKALIGRAVLFVGVDSGPMHIAEAVGTPVVALFGSQDPGRWGPRGAADIVVRKNWDCVPCRKEGCDGNGSWSRCLDELTVEEVLPAVALQMERIGDTGGERGRQPSHR